MKLTTVAFSLLCLLFVRCSDSGSGSSSNHDSWFISGFGKKIQNVPSLGDPQQRSLKRAILISITDENGVAVKGLYNPINPNFDFWVENCSSDVNLCSLTKPTVVPGPDLILPVGVYEFELYIPFEQGYNMGNIVVQVFLPGSDRRTQKAQIILQ